jgi:signal recognition particle subunit SRP14
MLLENDHFLLELTKLFQQQRVKNSGSLSLTMKRHDGRTKPKAQLTKKQRLEQKKSSTPTASNPSTTHESVEYKCLVRATFGSKKLSTVVSSKDINRFQLAYSNLLKANMDTLKKKAKENKTTGQASTTNPNSNIPSSPTAPSPSVSNQQKKTPTTPAKKK